jgi:IS30 family transposase
MRNVDPTEAEKIANELAGMVAREHRRTKIEQGRREAAESIAADLAILLAHDRADLERERDARQRVEAQLHELLSPDEVRVQLSRDEERTPRFVPAARAPRRLHRVR